MTRTLALSLLLSVPFLALAQSEPRGTVPPGTTTDGSRPADGAIKGGTILPGERGGTPDNPPMSERRAARCNELSGTLRDECLRREEDASAGASRTRPDPKAPSPSAPPPQNPR